MVRYVVDTDVCIYVMKGLPSAVAFWQRIQGATVLFSVITKAELLSHPELTEEDRRRINAFLDAGVVVDVDGAIAEQAAELRRVLGQQGRKMRLPDALIAATAVTEGAVLVTHNVDDYRAAAAIVALAVEDPIEPTDLCPANQPAPRLAEPEHPDRAAKTATEAPP